MTDDTSTYRAVVAVAVAGEPVDAGDTFDATDEQVADAVAAGLVEPVHTPAEKRAAARAKKDG
jgi:hypothetical protein